MSSPRLDRTVTLVGLPLRKGQLIRSMLLAVSAQTSDRWSIVDGADADVAICDTSSPLSLSARARGQASGRPRCVWLGEADPDEPDRTMLGEPIGTAALIALLDDVSNDLRPAAGAAPAPAVSERPFDAILVIQALLERDTRDVYRVDVGDLAVQVLPAARTVRLPFVLSSHTVSLLAETAGDPRIERLADGDVDALPHAVRGEELLWRVGLASRGDALLPSLPPAGEFTLKRWPDLKRLEHDAVHVRMCAFLLRRAHGVDELSITFRTKPPQVRAFINACALIGILDVRPPAGARAPDAEARPGYVRRILKGF